MPEKMREVPQSKTVEVSKTVYDTMFCPNILFEQFEYVFLFSYSKAFGYTVKSYKFENIILR